MYSHWDSKQAFIRMSNPILSSDLEIRLAAEVVKAKVIL